MFLVVEEKITGESTRLDPRIRREYIGAYHKKKKARKVLKKYANSTEYRLNRDEIVFNDDTNSTSYDKILGAKDCVVFICTETYKGSKTITWVTTIILKIIEI